MRIDNMDVSAASHIKVSNLTHSGADINENTNTSTNKSVSEGKPVSQMSEIEKRELRISDRVVIDAIEKANKAISVSNRKFEYSIHEKTKEIMIKVIDSDTNEVVREIPPEKILDMVAKMWEMAGLIVDERR